MSSSERNAKIYGAVETETFITFEGFCKKIYHTEQQKIEVFIDNEKIDTILANQKISNIEDTYEVFDTEGFCFTYKLPQKYIGKKHKLEFKNIDGEQLIHSPFSTIDVTNEKYNEYCFLERLKEPIDEEKIKDIYCPNCIGFLATKENLEDEKFITYIKELIVMFPDVKFYTYSFIDINLLIEKIKRLELKINIELSSEHFLKNLKVFIHNNNIINPNYLDTANKLMKRYKNVYVSYYLNNFFDNKAIKDYVYDKNDYYLNTLSDIGIDKKIFETFDYNYEKILNTYLFQICNYTKIEITDDLQMNFLKNYIHIDLALSCNNFIEKIYFLRKIHLKF